MGRDFSQIRFCALTTPYPSQEGNYFAEASCRTPSSEGLGLGRFMGRDGVRAVV
jgi:hypothetical protein